MLIAIKRVYEQPDAQDGYRVLVDRLWPRGVSKARAELDEWCKDVAPSAELRVWFGHRADRFEEFGQRYTIELESSDAPQALLGRAAGADRLTLVYAAKDPRVNHALVLADFLRRLARGSSSSPVRHG